MANLLTTTEEKGYVVLTLAGSLTKDKIGLLKEDIEASKAAIREASNKGGRKIRVLLDMGGFDGSYDVSAMEEMIAFAKHNADFVEKTAAFGSEDKAMIAGEITAALANRENIEFFGTKQQAVAWLTE